MTAFSDYYLVKVEEFLGRETTSLEAHTALNKYIEGWHPSRTAELIKEDAEVLESNDDKRKVL